MTDWNYGSVCSVWARTGVKVQAPQHPAMTPWGKFHMLWADGPLRPLRYAAIAANAPAWGLDRSLYQSYSTTYKKAMCTLSSQRMSVSFQAMFSKSHLKHCERTFINNCQYYIHCNFISFAIRRAYKTDNVELCKMCCAFRISISSQWLRGMIQRPSWLSGKKISV